MTFQVLTDKTSMTHL